jgi:hypothetical protein
MASPADPGIAGCASLDEDAVQPARRQAVTNP